MASETAKKVLLVEDEAIIALAGRRSLEGFGFQVVTARSGEAGVDIASSSPDIDLVLMDIDLGRGIDGTEAARRILAIRSIPIIFHTSHSERSMVERVRGITRYGYVIKNSGDFVLRSSIEMAFDLFDAHRRTKEREESLLRAEGIAEFGSWELSLEDGRFTVSAGARAIYGLDTDVLSLDYVQKIPCHQYRAALDDALNGLIEEGAPYGLGFEIVRPIDGRHAFIYSAAKYDAALRRVTGVICDITEQNRAEDALRRSEARYRMLFEKSNDAIFVVDSGTGAYQDANHAAEVLTGRSAAELKTLSTQDISPGGAARRLEMMAGAEGALDFGEVEYERPDGSRRTAILNTIFLERGLAFGIAHDITAEKKAKDALIESEMILREAEEIAGMGSYVLDIAAGTWKSSKVLDGIFGIEENYERTVEGWALLIHPEDRPVMVAYFRDEVLGKGLLFDREYRILQHDLGIEHRVHGMGRLELDEAGTAVKMYGTIQDLGRRGPGKGAAWTP